MKNLRNIIIAVLLLVFLLVSPFWGSIKGALGLDRTDGETGASPESAGYAEEKP